MPVAGEVLVLVSDEYGTALPGVVVLESLRDAPRLPLEVDRNDRILFQSKICSLELFCDEERRQTFVTSPELHRLQDLSRHLNCDAASGMVTNWLSNLTCN